METNAQKETGRSIVLRDKEGRVKEDLKAISEKRKEMGEIALDQSKLIRFAIQQLRKKLKA
jgi:hypothetical protein